MYQNSRELEGIMLKTFCASVNLKSLLLQHHDMPVIEKFKAIIEQAMKDSSLDPFADIMLDSDPTVPSTTLKRCHQSTLSERALSALHTMYQQLFNQPMPSAIICHSKHIIGKFPFTTQAESKRDCIIFFRSTTDSVMTPGIIQYIVSIPSISVKSKNLFFVIEGYAQLLETTLNPFSSHAPFGASLWSSKMLLVLEAVPVDHVICHPIST